jgi:hypothetical protein
MIVTKLTNLEISELDKVIGAGISIGTAAAARGGPIFASDVLYYAIWGMGAVVSKPIEMPGYGTYAQTRSEVFHN